MKNFFLFFLLLFFCISLSFSQDTLMNGYVKLKFDNGVVSSEGYMKDGLPDGYWKSYNKKGILISEGNRKDFLLDSLWKFYKDDGKISMSIYYSKGKKNGIKTTYQMEETVEEEFKDNIKIGVEKIYDKNKKLKKLTPFENGLEEGFSKEFNENGLIIVLTEYSKGYIKKREFINRMDASGLKQGLWKYFYDDDNLHIEVNYLNNKKHGIYKEYTKDGNLLKIEKYENDQIIQNALETRKLEMRIDYHKNGAPKIMGTYFNGIAEGIRREYNEKGQIIQSYVMKSGRILGKGVLDANGLKQGIWEEYYDDTYAKPNEIIIRSKGQYKNSKPIGEWKYFMLNGYTEIEGSYDINGKKEGTWTWYYPNGKILIQENYVEGYKEGLFIEFDENKNVILKGNFVEDKEVGFWIRHNKDFIEEGNYVDGRREGKWKGYYKNGNTTYETSFADNNYNGSFVSYWENGKIKEQGNYLFGLKNGTWRQFDSFGNLFLMVTYKKGIEIRYEGVKIEPTLEDGE